MQRLAEIASHEQYRQIGGIGKGGHASFFWRWPSTHSHTAHDGYPAYVMGLLPRNIQPQLKKTNCNLRGMIKAKLNTLRSKEYIAQCHVESLTRFFAVPKGVSGIRMVYDATQSGLNEALWSPNFQLPTMDTLARAVSSSA
jgi:hypothetical protein